MLVRFPTVDVAIWGKSRRSSPFSCHVNLTGKSPSDIEQPTCRNWPEWAGLSSKLNGVILGSTGCIKNIEMGEQYSNKHVTIMVSCMLRHETASISKMVVPFPTHS